MGEGDRFAAFCAQLTQWVDDFAGLPLLLEPWQREFFDEALASDEHGAPLYNSAVLCVARKNGKTALLAAYAVYKLLGDGSPEILLAAASDKQAGRLFDACARFVRGNAKLRDACQISEYKGVISGPNGGRILRMSTDANTLYGYSPSLVICDELAFWTTPTLRSAWNALTTGGGARSHPQTFVISTAGEAHTRHDSLLGRLLDAAQTDPELEQRPGLEIGRLREARTLIWSYSAPTTDRHDIAALKLANPASWITEADLERQAANPELTDAAVLQLHGCVWAARSSSWLPAGAWEALESPYRLPPDEAPIVVFFDGAEHRDSTVAVGCTVPQEPGEKPHLFRIFAHEKPERAAGWTVDRDAVHADVRALFRRWDVYELAADPHGWQTDLQQWQDEHGDAVTVFDTRLAAFGVALDDFFAAVVNGDITHDGDPRFAAHLHNAVYSQSGRGSRINKDHPDSPRKIDLAVCAAGALARARFQADANTREYVLDTRRL